MDRKVFEEAKKIIDDIECYSNIVSTLVNYGSCNCVVNSINYMEKGVPRCTTTNIILPTDMVEYIISYSKDRIVELECDLENIKC